MKSILFPVPFLLFTCVAVLHSQNTQQYPPISKQNVLVKTIPPLLIPPAEIGGKAVWGEARVSILLHSSGRILVSRISSIEASRDSSAPALIYEFSGGPLAYWDTTVKSKTVERFISYVEDIVALTQYQVDFTNPYFAKYSSFWIIYVVQLNPFKSTYD